MLTETVQLQGTEQRGNGVDFGKDRKLTAVWWLGPCTLCERPRSGLICVKSAVYEVCLTVSTCILATLVQISPGVVTERLRTREQQPETTSLNLAAI